jgi:hypothetical protein
MKKRLLILILMLIPLISKAEVIWHPMPPEAYKLGEVYPEAQKLLFAFDYGHGLVYERLIINRGKITDPEGFEKQLLADIFWILKNPPNVKVDEADIAPAYVYKFPKIVSLFDWSHLLHQFVLDILATSKDRGPAMINRINEIYAHYNTMPKVAITEVCKTMMFMDGHYFSKAFRNNFPSFNLLIWSYHWFQIKLYEDLLAPTKKERDLAVEATIKEFWNLISDLPDSAYFDMMPETAVEAPTFAKLFPKIPFAFDNNHMLHDIVSDLLVSTKVSDSALRSEGMRMAAMALDPNAFKCQ